MKLLHGESTFLQRLRNLDYELFLEIKKSRSCPKCKGQLDTANYPRKPRGVPADEESSIRYSLCCRQEGCRTRLTPPSIRFLGRKVYAAIIVILAVDFHNSLGLKDPISRRTLGRWRNFWREQLSESAVFMKRIRARGILPVQTPPSFSPKTILRSLGFPEEDAWILALKCFTGSRSE